MRTATVQRNTNETKINLTLDLDHPLRAVKTNCGFLNHMLDLFAVHSGFGLSVDCTGDVEVDFHHTVEDVGIALGQAFLSAIGDKRGIRRYADIMLPMDETLILCAVDISGRGYLNYDVQLPAAKVFDGEDVVKAKSVGLFDSELIEEFFIAFSREAKITLHISKMYGKNTHHIIEGIFKAVGRVLGSATRIISDQIPSSKGTLSV